LERSIWLTSELLRPRRVRSYLQINRDIPPIKEQEGEMKQEKSWKIIDAFWEKAESLLPPKEWNPGKEYRRRPGGGQPPQDAWKIPEAIFYVLRTGIP
jgi:hypothetical protein